MLREKKSFSRLFRIVYLFVGGIYKDLEQISENTFAICI